MFNSKSSDNFLKNRYKGNKGNKPNIDETLILKSAIYLFYYEKNKEEILKQKDNKFYLINYDWIIKFKNIVSFEEISKILISNIKSSINYNNLSKNEENIIDEVRKQKKEIIKEKNKLSELIDTNEFIPKKIKNYETITSLYYYIIPSKIFDIFKDSFFKKKILFIDPLTQISFKNNNKIYIQEKDIIKVGIFDNTSKFIVEYIFIYNHEAHVTNEFKDLQKKEIERYITDQMCKNNINEIQIMKRSRNGKEIGKLKIIKNKEKNEIKIYPEQKDKKEFCSINQKSQKENDKMQSLEKKIDEKFNDLFKRMEENYTLIERRFNIIDKKFEEINDNNKKIKTLNNLNDSKKEDSKQLNSLKEKDNKINQLTQEITKSKDKLKEKENEVNNLKKEIEKLKEENKQLKQRNDLNYNMQQNSVDTKMVLNSFQFKNNNLIHKAENKLIGLKNIGQASYINPVLQSLIQTESLTNYFNNYNINQNMKLAKNYQELIKGLSQVNNGSINPQNVIKAINEKSKTINNIYQFMHFILVQLNEELTVKRIQDINYNINKNRTEIESIKKVLGNKTSIIEDIFQGIEEEITQCTSTNINNQQFHCKTFLYLLFDLNKVQLNENEITIFNYLVEMRREQNTIKEEYCEECKKDCYVHHIPKFIFPKVLIILLNYDNNYIKVNFEEDLDLTPFTKLENEDKTEKEIYSLYSVITKVQNYQEKYVAYCKNKEDNNWYRFDDEDINYIGNIDDIRNIYINQEFPLILFYKKK